MKILSHSGNEVYVGHFQGNAVKHYLDVVEEFSLKKVNISPRVSVITAYTDHEKAITALQLELSRIPYVNACPNDAVNWSNVDKIKYFVSALEQTTSEYSFLVDGYDVLFFKDIDEEFITKFEEKGKKFLFNATKNKYPKICIEENEDSLEEFKYLNAGVVFGKTEDLYHFYQNVLETTKRTDIMNPWNSEQLYVRIAAKDNEDVGIDQECSLFQTFSKTKKTVCGDILIIE